MYILIKGDVQMFEHQLRSREEQGYVVVGSHQMLQIKDQYNNFTQYSAIMFKPDAPVLMPEALQLEVADNGGE